MKKRKIITISIITILTLLIGGLTIFFVLTGKDNKNSPTQEEKKESTSTPLLYEVTKENSDTKIYLFGSIHVANDKAYPLPNKILEAYKTSDFIAVEFDMIEFSTDFSAQTEAAQKFLCPDGKKLKDVMYEDSYNLLINYLKENNQYNSLYEYYRPVMFYSIIQNIMVEKTKLDSNKGIDMYFLKQAKKDKKEILEIESAQYQYDLLSSFPDKLFDLLIKYSIKNEEQMIKDTKDLYDAWLTGNKEKIIESSTDGNEEDFEEGFEEYDDDLEIIIADYSERLITKRNIEMLEKVKQYFKEEKNVFVVVGAAHIVGDGALVELLTSNDYNVTQINY